MPPFVSRKRDRSPSPKANAASKRTAVSNRGKPVPSEVPRITPRKSRTVAESKALLNSVVGEDETSLSEVDSDDFEDVDISKGEGEGEGEDETDGAADTDEDMDWEDALGSASGSTGAQNLPSRAREIKDLEITLGGTAADVPTDSAAVLGKKGPSRKERFIRIQTHCLHVQCLLYHNFLRNSWINDKKVHEFLTAGLSDMIKSEVERYRRAMGIPDQLESSPFRTKTGKKNSAANKNKTPRKGTLEDSQKQAREKIRDWGADSAQVEPNTPNLSRGDPLLRLLKYLSAYWRKRFRITSPGLRKRGYLPPALMAEEIRSFRKDPHEPARHGERITNLEEFRNAAKTCEGSRDIGAQLFTALLRGLRIEARLVASLQPIGFGWNKSEEANFKKSKDGKSIIGETTTPKSSKKSSKQNTTVNNDASENSSDLSSAPEDLSDDSLIDISPSKRKPSLILKKQIDDDLPFPIYWTEALSPVTNTYIPCSPLVISALATNAEQLSVFEPRGKQAEKSKQVLAYLVAYSSDGSAKDVTVRYLKRRQLPGKTKGVRLPVEKVPIYNKKGKVKRYEQYDWFKDIMRSYTRSSEKRTLADTIEDEGDLVPFKVESKTTAIERGEESLQAYKASAEYVLERHLRREEALLPSAKPVKHFSTRKGESAKSEPVYLRKDVVTCKTVESWHKEGREVKEGEQPLKQVPIRAVTLIRKREIEDQIRENGEKPLQGLYSRKQTDWIIPDPIQDGKIPRNAFGNIDVYVPSMVPQGAVHVRLKGTGKICKKLGIDYAEACTGFEFGKQRAVPVLTGVVVAEENEDLLREAWAEEEENKRRKEEGKREKAALAMWRKFLMGLRIIERVREEYGNGGDVRDEINPFTNRNRRLTTAIKSSGKIQTTELGGGFIPESHADEEQDTLADKEPCHDDGGGGGFIIEHDNTPRKNILDASGNSSSMPISLQAAHADKLEDDGSQTSLSDGVGDTSPSIKAETTSPSNLALRGGKRKAAPRTIRERAAEDQKTISQGHGSRKKQAKKSTESEASLSDPTSTDQAADDSDDSEPAPPSERKPLGRSLPTRRAARKSQTAIRSHYFEQSSADDGSEVPAKGSARKRRTQR